MLLTWNVTATVTVYLKSVNRYMATWNGRILASCTLSLVIKCAPGTITHIAPRRFPIFIAYEGSARQSEYPWMRRVRPPVVKHIQDFSDECIPLVFICLCSSTHCFSEPRHFQERACFLGWHLSGHSCPLFLTAHLDDAFQCILPTALYGTISQQNSEKQINRINNHIYNQINGLVFTRHLIAHHTFLFKVAGVKWRLMYTVFSSSTEEAQAPRHRNCQPLILRGSIWIPPAVLLIAVVDKTLSGCMAAAFKAIMPVKDV